MLCPKCQKENLEGAKFCAFCGMPLEAINSQPEVQSNLQPSVSAPIPQEVSAGGDKKVSKIIVRSFWIIGLVLTFVIVGGCFFLIALVAMLGGIAGFSVPMPLILLTLLLMLIFSALLGYGIVVKSKSVDFQKKYYIIGIVIFLIITVSLFSFSIFLINVLVASDKENMEMVARWKANDKISRETIGDEENTENSNIEKQTIESQKIKQAITPKVQSVEKVSAPKTSILENTEQEVAKKDIEIPSDISLIPMYGGYEKTPFQKTADKDFIEQALSHYQTNEDASNAFVAFGKQFIEKGDFDTSMRRFNQAWLLNDKNPDVFVGFGDILKKQGNEKEAMVMYEKAEALK